MPFRLRKFFAVAVAALALTASAKPVPDLRFKDLAGQPQKLSSLRGSVAVVNFWATWCASCREEIPRLAVLKQRYAGKGVRFVAISADDPKDRVKVEQFFHVRAISLEIWLGADLDTLDRLQLGNALPATLVLDQDGNAIGRIEGEAREADITAYLDWLLGGRPGPAPAPLVKHV